VRFLSAQESTCRPLRHLKLKHKKSLPVLL
jgi:hypothetical protein